MGKELWDSRIAQWVEHYKIEGDRGIAQWAEHYGIVG